MANIRKHRSGFSDPYVVKDSFQDDNEIFYCTECQGELNQLFPRANYNESDADQWLQCRVCGDIKHKNELKHISKLESFAVTSDNPYERRDLVIGLEIKIKLTSKENELGSKDIRDVIKVARLASSIEEIPFVVRILNKQYRFDGTNKN
jgi:hypothetical protein